MLQLQLMDENKLNRAKKVLEIIKMSERVIINKENEELYFDKVLTDLKASVLLYDIQQQIKKLYNPAFILILRLLKLDEHLLLNKYAKVVIPSTNTEQAKTKAKKQRFHKFAFNIYSPPFSQETVNKVQLKKQ